MPKICIDAGHYGKQNWNPKTDPVYWESLMAWELHLALRQELLQYEGIEVITTREAEEKDLELTARGRKAIGCDLFLSLHSNAVANPTYNDSTDRAVVIYPVSGKERNLADALSVCITEAMGLKDKPQLYQRWNSSHNADYYGVIRGAASVGVPGLILEHSFHTNKRAAEWLLNSGNLRTLAAAEAKVIAARYGCKKSSGEKTEYALPLKVQIGAYNVPENAQRQKDLAREKGFDAFIVDANGKAVTLE